jgi:glycosyltransferase involved in cell wall biosynthesis
VVTPTFNAAAFVEETLQSVLEQGYDQLEYIVQDGASTDRTLEIISRYAARLASVDSRRDAGQSDALNMGFGRATGEIMAYLNGDDLLLPGALHYVAWFFARHPEVDVAYGHRVLIDGDGWEIGRWVLPRHDDAVLSWVDYVPQETLFWRRAIWEKVGATLDETFHFAMDWDLLLRFRDAGARFARVPRFLGAFRVHRGQKTSARMRDTGMREMERLRQRVHGQTVPAGEIARGIRSYLRRHMVYQKLYNWGLLRY